MNPQDMQARDDRLWAEVDRLLVPSQEIDQFESDNFADQVVSIEEYRARLKELSRNPEQAKGKRLPWFKADNMRIREGEISIWSGFNGHGKSLALSQAALFLHKQGEQIAIASLELRPEETLQRMAAQANGIAWDQLTDRAIDDFFNAFNTMRLYTEVGDLEPHRALAFCRWCHANGVNQVILDSLMKCGIDEHDHKAEKKFINSLQNIAKNTGLHIHLVAHAKKPERGSDEENAPRKYDISGSHKIPDMVDNILIVSRNKKKERILDNGGDCNEYDTYIEVAKQRHYTWEKTFGLYFHESGQFMESMGKKVVYV